MLWGNKDYPSGNQKPLFANTTLTTSKSTINDGVANTNKYYGAVAGVSAGEQTRASAAPKPQHSGWVSLKVGTGSITGVSITNGGNVTSNGFIVLTDGSTLGKGANANIKYTINAVTNTVTSVTLNKGGDGWSNVSAITYKVTGANTTQPTLSLTLGGRAGRVTTETLVAMGTITLDAPSDNVFFAGV